MSEFRVIQCLKCKMYQVDFVKKTKKWQCKICRERQDFLKEFFRGSSAECRNQVQQMNLVRGIREERRMEDLFITAREKLEHSKENCEKQENTLPKKETNKWASYVDETTKTTPQSLGIDNKELHEGLLINSNKRVSKRYFKIKPKECKKLCSESKWNGFL
ncbi:MRN complex-interacting protein [Drosophila eugracilis]|uniref:MRN complex-interacting protein n=1 Tax=Drosophila eugracilis TaxID=29029 RepID=UPI0007E8582C|nr:MRN complex-interacting protein [Drosophila eugracilis]